MSAADQEMTIKKIVWHTAANTLEFTLQSREGPPRPEWIQEDRWYGGAGDEITVTAPAKKITTTAPTGVAMTIGLNGELIYTKYTWNATTQAWVNPVRVDGNTWLPL